MLRFSFDIFVRDIMDFRVRLVQLEVPGPRVKRERGVCKVTLGKRAKKEIPVSEAIVAHS